jgi:hypothetical protein
MGIEGMSPLLGDAMTQTRHDRRLKSRVAH